MKRYRTFLLILALLIVVLFNTQNIYKAYIYLFKVTTVIKQYNNKGQYDGEVVSYVRGRVNSRENFSNGVREGWTRYYFENGQLKNEIFFNHDHVNGIEKYFFINGNINYTMIWDNNLRSKGEYYNPQNGGLKTYVQFDKNSTEIVSYVQYNQFKKISKTIGNVFSDNIYSKLNGSDSTVFLRNSTSYSNVKDLYITVATPPGLTPQIEANINNIKYTNLAVKSSPLIIPNLFTKEGDFSITISGKLIDSNKKTIKTDSLDIRIKVVR